MVDGASLRVNVDGKVIALIRSGKNFYAIQDFCTHRFGPLTEGKISEGIVECPWHRSCFELKSGKVAKGPAKEKLKTYPVTVKDGKIFVEL